MSDTPQGDGWWQASDGKWYPPEQRPSDALGTPGATPGGGAGGAVTLDIGAALSYGWNKFVQYIGTIILIVLVIFGVNLFFNIIANTADSIFVRFIFQVVGFVVAMILQLGLIRVGLAITAGREPQVDMLFRTEHLPAYIGATLLFGLGVFIGFFALCIGALIVAFFLWFYGFFIVDQDQGPTEALGSSFNLVKNNFGQVLLFALVAVILWAVTCGLASAIIMISTAYVYRTLNGQPVAA